MPLLGLESMGLVLGEGDVAVLDVVVGVVDKELDSPHRSSGKGRDWNLGQGGLPGMVRVAMLGIQSELFPLVLEQSLATSLLGRRKVAVSR